MSDEQDETRSAASLTASVLDEEAARQAAQIARSKEVLFADDMLPGVGSEEMTLREGLKKGGPFTFGTLLVLNSLDELEAAAVRILGPEIGETFNISDGAVTAIGGAGLIFFLLGGGPLGYLADRVRRGPLVAIASTIFAVFSFLTGMAVNAFMFFWTRVFVGVSRANTVTVHPSLLADTYPIAIRGRMYATNSGVGRVFDAMGPVLAGGIAVTAGGVEGWRWAYLLLGIPVGIAAVFAFFIPEPERGQWEKKDVLGHSFGVDMEEIPISVGAAFNRIWRIDTIRNMTMGLVAIGFALFPLGSLQAFFLDEEFGLDPLQRGWATFPTGLLIVLALPWLGRKFDQTFRVAPDRALRLIGMLLIPVGVLVPLQYSMPNIWLFVLIGTITGTFLGAAFSMIQPSIQPVLPYRLRGMGGAIVLFFIAALGGLGGILISAFLQDQWGERFAASIIPIFLMPIGGYNILKSSRSVRRDLSLVVEELQEEQAYFDLVAAGSEVPAMQVKHIDFSYGQVQVLFDVSFEVKKGECLALLGTNGAGKSTILRVISGLETPERGVVRYHGRAATFAAPETRAALGIQMLPGGKGVWPNLTIGDNLDVGAYQYRNDPADVARRKAHVLELFPALQDRLDERAGDLSGGQQQMLALARIMLHEPDLLIIDELSLGLAPTVVQDLLTHIDRLRNAGQTMIIVEQSLNVALAISDRAIFLEKGQVRFEGSAQELAERDDLARAVFLGKEGG
ncbi:MAG: ATP-binding protein [Acidimicrobiales bacterium]|jgi:ABC-type branched-subunit amino acid transport system ATPase component/uncharacterized protein YjeT (DUF2065 family)|nr:ATP-binding protein [Acidimicrobiales bacterium]